MPRTKQLVWRASCAISGLALQVRPKKVTSTPRNSCWSTSMATWPPRSRTLARRIGASKPEGISVPMQPAHRYDGVGDGAHTGRTEQHGRLDAEARGGERRQLPVGEMRRECGRRPRRTQDVLDAAPRFRIAQNTGLLRIDDVDPVEMGELRADAAEIVPHPSKNCLDLLRRLLGKRGHEIGAADLVFRKEGADATHEPTGHVGKANTIAAPNELEDGNRHQADDGIKGLLVAASEHQRETHEARVHRGGFRT